MNEDKKGILDLSTLAKVVYASNWMMIPKT